MNGLLLRISYFPVYESVASIGQLLVTLLKLSIPISEFIARNVYVN